MRETSIAGSGSTEARCASLEDEMTLYVGTYTDETGSEGVYAVTPSRSIALLSDANPSFLIRRGTALFAACESPESARVAAYSLRGGKLEHIRTESDRTGAGTCHVTLHPSGRWLYGSNYESGSLSCWPVRLDGRLGPVSSSVIHSGEGPISERQGSAHVHSSHFIGKDTLAVADLGNDAVTIYRATERDGLLEGAIAIQRMPAGFGPRMLATRPAPDTASQLDGSSRKPSQIAVIGELANAVIIYEVASGAQAGETDPWREITRIDLIEGLRGSSAETEGKPDALAAHVEFSPCGRYLYASVRGPDVIVSCELDAEGRVIAQASHPSGGREPRHFSPSPCGRFMAVANQGSDEVAVFAVRRESKADACFEELYRLSVPAPSCVIW